MKTVVAGAVAATCSEANLTLCGPFLPPPGEGCARFLWPAFCPFLPPPSKQSVRGGPRPLVAHAHRCVHPKQHPEQTRSWAAERTCTWNTVVYAPARTVMDVEEHQSLILVQQQNVMHMYLHMARRTPKAVMGDNFRVESVLHFCGPVAPKVWICRRAVCLCVWACGHVRMLLFSAGQLTSTGGDGGGGGFRVGTTLCGKFRFSIWCEIFPAEFFGAIWGISCSLCLVRPLASLPRFPYR